ncbi:MAG: lysophospholipid acyltransferase family protein [Chthoniobacterales bacterium]
MAIFSLNKKGSQFPYFLCRKITRLIFRLFCRVHLVTLETPPQYGPCIVASNHISHFEPTIISSFFLRPLDWITMEELFHHPWSKKFFLSLNAIPVNRLGNNPSSHRKSLRTILERLAQQRMVGIFPEGGIRSQAASILEGAPMKPGLASISILSQAPIVPCVVLGSDRLYHAATWFQRPSLWIIIGKKILPPSKKATAEEKKSFQEQLSAVFPTLQAELCQRFHLSHNDLPKAFKNS